MEYSALDERTIAGALESFIKADDANACRERWVLEYTRFVCMALMIDEFLRWPQSWDDKCHDKRQTATDFN